MLIIIEIEALYISYTYLKFTLFKGTAEWLLWEKDFYFTGAVFWICIFKTNPSNELF